MTMDSGNAKSTLGRKIAQRALVLAEPYLFSERVDEHGEVIVPKGLHALGVRLNQAVVERGKTPPWVMTDEECRAFWASRVPGGPDNDPVDIARKPTEILDFLDGFWSPHVGKEDAILELGCNAGGNLAGLWRLGYRNLSGVEINPVALEVFQSEHPQAFEAVQLHQGSIEEMLPTLPDNAYDCVFTGSVSIHIHPASHRVFEEMTRVSRGYICLVESEVANGRYTFARNYKRVFERLGCTQLREEQLDRHSHPELERPYDGYMARLFRVGHR